MSPVSLREVVGEIDVPVSGCATYVNRKTGEVVVVTEDASLLLRDDLDEDGLQDWEAEMLPKLREATTSDDYVEFSIREVLDEYHLMERFARAAEDPSVSARLLRAIQGRGAFRYFKDVAHEHGLLDDWYDYRQHALEEAVAEWLGENGIEFTRP